MTHAIASRYPARSGEQGFTLVELAIVLIIIGLLIGGILKGQELIANAQVKSVASQIKGFDAAVTTFRDSYGTLPGDIGTPATRLPNCTAVPCTTVGDNDGIIDTLAMIGPGSGGGEGAVMWTHMAAADIVTGIQGAVFTFPNGALPAASIGGGFWAGHTSNTGGDLALTDATALRQGHYFVFNGTPGTPVAAGTGGLQPLQAERIDRIMDDGLPNTGTVRAFGAAGCAPGGAASLYNSGSGGVAVTNCGLYIRFQG